MDGSWPSRRGASIAYYHKVIRHCDVLIVIRGEDPRIGSSALRRPIAGDLHRFHTPSAYLLPLVLKSRDDGLPPAVLPPLKYLTINLMASSPWRSYVRKRAAERSSTRPWRNHLAVNRWSLPGRIRVRFGALSFFLQRQHPAASWPSRALRRRLEGRRALAQPHRQWPLPPTLQS